MMKSLIFCLVLIVFKLFIIPFSQHDLVGNNREIKSLKSELVAAKNCKAELLSKNNQLCLRERICAYAQSNLGLMNPINADTTSTTKISFVKESKQNENIVYSLIDFISPNAHALTE